MKKLPPNRRLAVLAACVAAIVPSLYLLIGRQAEHNGGPNWVTFAFGLIVGLSLTLAVGLTVKWRMRG